MIILKSELIKYKDKTILKETTDRKKNKIEYSIINNENQLFCGVVFTKLSDVKKYIDIVENKGELKNEI